MRNIDTSLVHRQRSGDGDRDWMIQARCRGHENPDLWFPVSKDRENSADAIQECWRCPVRAECANYAEQLDIPYGIWGGQRQGERHRTRTAGGYE